MHWNASLKESNESSRFWYGSKSSKKTRKTIWGCRMVRVEVVSEDVGVNKNGARAHVVRKYFPTRPRTKLPKKHLWVGGSCWIRGIEFKLVVKAWAYKKIPLVGFLNRLLKNIWTESLSPYAQWSPPWVSKTRHHSVIGGINAKLPHHRGIVPTYLMGKKMQFVHHVVKGSCKLKCS